MPMKLDILERDVEAQLKRSIRKAGGIPYKFNTPGRRAAPDLIIFWPPMGGKLTTFVEAKRPGKTATPAQVKEHIKLRKAGYQVDVIDSIVDAKEYPKQFEYMF